MAILYNHPTHTHQINDGTLNEKKNLKKKQLVDHKLCDYILTKIKKK